MFALSTGRHVRRCLWHQYSPTCGARGKSRSKWVVRRAERAARASTIRSTSCVVYSGIRDRKWSNSAAACGANHSLAKPRGRSAERPQALTDLAHIRFQRLEIVLAGLDRDQERVESGDVDTDGVVARLEGLHERRPRAGEGVEHATARAHVSRQQRLDQLRHELAEVGVQPVHVLRPLALGQLALGPGEREVELAVELGLSQSHVEAFAAL